MPRARVGFETKFQTSIEVPQLACPGEKVWRMPMEESYWEDMKSPIADMRNAGTIRYGGAITAALFLKQYIDPKKACKPSS